MDNLEFLKRYIIEEVQAANFLKNKYFDELSTDNDDFFYWDEVGVTKAFVFSEDTINDFFDIAYFFDNDEHYSWVVEDLDGLHNGISYKRLLVSYR